MTTTAPSCTAHHWLCDQPVMGITAARCKHCGAEREFVNEDLLPPGYNQRKGIRLETWTPKG